MSIEELMQEYTLRNPTSASLWKEACEVLPGGISGNVKFYSPFPLFMQEGYGAYLKDADGHEYVDYELSFGPLILGHGRKEIVEAVNDYMARHGTMLYGTPHEEEASFARLLQSYFPSIESLRYTNSGTEATLLSIRTAYAYTGKHKIAKFEGHYHGGYNEVLVSVNPSLDSAGDARHPNALRHSAGISDEQLSGTVVLPFNDLESCQEILKEQKDSIAAVIMEPLLGGTLPATKQFMAGLRKVTEELGILLIMDEVKTGFRCGMNGAQGYYGVKPDMTTLGKIIGGGFPVGVLGGRKEILELAAPRGTGLYGSGIRTNGSSLPLFHSGTYNGHPVILHAGARTLEILAKEWNDLAKNTEELKKGIQDVFARHGIHVLTPGMGAMFDICITDKDSILSFRDQKTCDNALRKKIDYALLLNGIYNKPCKRYHMSTAHTEDVVGKTLDAYERVLGNI